METCSAQWCFSPLYVRGSGNESPFSITFQYDQNLVKKDLMEVTATDLLYVDSKTQAQWWRSSCGGALWGARHWQDNHCQCGMRREYLAHLASQTSLKLMYDDLNTVQEVESIQMAVQQSRMFYQHLHCATRKPVIWTTAHSKALLWNVLKRIA